jgi:hypothetical protein
LLDQFEDWFLVAENELCAGLAFGIHESDFTPDGSKTLIEWRADVFRLLDANNDGVVTANEANGSHALSLPGNNSGGNGVPFSQGASLVMIYRSHREPLRAIVLYEGGFTMDNQTDAISQNITGFYQASTSNPQTKLTMIVGDGQDNFSEQVLVGGTVVATNPFISDEGDSWDNPTFTTFPTTNAPLLTGNASSTVVSIDHANMTPYDCLTGPAMILSTTVQDTDLDGLVDVWETAPPPVDPSGQPLPDLAAMGASPLHKDVFVEAAHFVAGANTTYGTGSSQVVDAAGHNHLLSAQAITMVGNAYAAAPVLNPDTTTGINFHIDVGNNLQSTPYVIPASLARGGETITERACVGTGCAFPHWPGTVGWKVGLQFYRDAPVKAGGGEFDPTVPADVAAETSCRDGLTQCRQRFDRNRKDMFHFALLAHAIGIRKSENQCVPPAVPNPTTGLCPAGTDNPDFYIPRSISGMGDFPGGDLLVTLGLWGNGFKGSDFVQGSTFLHEMGHGFWLTHAGDLFTAPPVFEDNCDSNYMSVMNYLFQIPGLTPDPPPPGPSSATAGSPTIDFSDRLLPSLTEASLPAGMGAMKYRTAYYAPLSGVHQLLQSTGAKKHCNGTFLSEAEELDRVNGLGWVRIDGTSATTAAGPTAIDWNGDLVLNDVGRSQDISFNGTTNTAANQLNGSSDWFFVASLPDPAPGSRKATGLQQLGSRRNAGGYSLDGKDFGGKDFGGKDFGGKDFGGKDFGGKDFGGKDFGGDQDRETATATPLSLNTLTAQAEGRNVRLTWKGPPAHPENAGVITYIIYRVDGTKVTDTAFAKRTTVGQTIDLTILDTKVTGGKTYTWFGVVKYPDGSQSAMSHSVTLTVPR